MPVVVMAGTRPTRDRYGLIRVYLYSVTVVFPSR